jgi:hypothetical protein
MTQFNPNDHVILEPSYDFFDTKIQYNDSQDWFCDDEFPADMPSVWRDEKHIPPGASQITQWLRPHQMSANPAMFIDGGSAGDVKQGRLGNCWFISALCILGARQDILDHCIVSMPRDARKGGKYSFRFYKEGEWITITVDDRLPCDEHGIPVFARCSDLNELWVPLFEKAYAKLMGAYGELVCGFINDALVDLTGGVATSVKVAPTNADDLVLWNDLAQKTESGCYLLGVSNQNGGIETNVGDTGLLAGHAYAILSCVEVNGHKLIKIRNPWSYGEWKGAWSDDAPEWTEDIKRKLKVTFGDDGEFYMCYEDFCKNWTNIDCVRVFNDPYESFLKNRKAALEQGTDFPEDYNSSSQQVDRQWKCAIRKGAWDKETAGGLFSANTARSKLNPQYLFHLEQDAEIVISLLQFDFRYYGDDKDESYPIGFHVCKYKGVYDKQAPHRSGRIFSCEPDAIVLKSKFEFSREVAIEGKLPAGVYMIVPSVYHENLLSTFTLRTFVKNVPFAVTAMPAESQCYDNTSLEGEWIVGRNAGGCMNTYKWIDNPQYKFSVNQVINISLTLEQILEENQQPAHISFYIAEANKSDPDSPVYEYVKAVEPSKFTSLREITNTFDAQPNKMYIIIPCTFQPDIARKFKLKVTYRKDIYPNATFQLASVTGGTDGYETITVKSEWSGANAGGCPNDVESWKKNPKFHLTLHADGPIQLLLCQEEKEQKLSGVGMHIYTGTKAEGKEMYKSKAWNFFRLSVAQMTLNAGTYTIMPSTFYKGEERPFMIKAVAKKTCGVTLEQVV